MTSDFFKSDSRIHLDKLAKEDDDSPAYLAGVVDMVYKVATAAMGLVLIVLAAVILARVSKIEIEEDQTGPVLAELSDNVEDVDRYQREELGPKTTLIHNTVTGSIPRTIAEMKNDILESIHQRCNPIINNGTESCELLSKQINDQDVVPLNPHTYWRCAAGQPGLGGSISLIAHSSEIPGSMAPAGCIRIPTLDIGPLIYSYSHNVITTGCDDHTASVQYWQLGYIRINVDGTPSMRPSRTHSFRDGVNRKSCSTVAVDRGAWLGCTDVTEAERADYASVGIQDLIINYMDLFGVVQTYRYNESEIEMDNKYDAFYFGVGAGVHYDGRILMMAYGGLRTPINVPAMCFAPGCPSPSQAKCNASQRLTYFAQKQLVNAIVEIIPVIGSKPIIRVTTISPSLVWLGAEARLIKGGDVLYIYIRSTGWHALAQTGIVTGLKPVTIIWTTNTAVSRPGAGSCSGTQRCPGNCLTGVYDDMFPLSPGFKQYSTVLLNSATTRIDPTISYGNTTNQLINLRVNTAAQIGSYSTTTCVTVKGVGYCYHVIELSPATMGQFQPNMLLTKVPKTCT